MSEETQGAAEAVTETAADQVADQTEAQVQEGESGDDAAAETDQPEQPRRKSAQDRIDELTRARREAEREAEHWRSIAQQQREPAPAKPEPKADDEPDPASYEYGETDLNYVKDLARYEARQEFRKQAQEEAAQRQAQEIAQGYAQREEATAAKYDDYEKAVYRSQWVCTPVMADAIKTSEAGPEVAYHLAKNPTEARRIAALSPIAQVRELTRLEVRLTSAPPAKSATEAPEPPPQARGAGGKFSVSPDTDDFAAFDKQYR